MFSTLSILYITITTTTVSFLTPQFVFSYIICIDNEHTYNYSIDYESTGHNYNIDVKNKDCIITINGSGILFPSWKDSISVLLK